MHAIKAWVGRHRTALGAGLVASALIILVIAAVVMVQGIGEQVASATGTAQPSPLPSSSPAVESGSAAPSSSTGSSEGPVWHDYQLTDVATPLFAGAWTKVTADRLNVRQEAGTASDVAGVAQLGDLLMVTGDPILAEEREWAPVIGNGLAGWVATSDAENGYLQPVATPWRFGSKRVLVGLIASADGLLIYGGASDLPMTPYEGTGMRALVAISSDGRSWQEVTDLGGPGSTATAGDGVYVLANEPSYIEPNVVRVSTDGANWSDPATLTFTARSAAFGPAGAVLMGSDWEGNVFAARVATDGRVEEVQLPAAENLPQSQLEGSSAGYVAFDRQNAPELLVSTNGRTWNRVVVPDADPAAYVIRDVELDGPRLMAVLGDTGNGATLLRYGQLTSDGKVAWETTSNAPFGSATVDAVTLGGGTFLAVGWDRTELVPRVWRSTDGRAWADLAVAPGTFGGAIGPEPVYSDGRWYAATDAIYASDDGGNWEEVFRPPTLAVEGPGCAAADDVTSLDLMFLGETAADCYADASLTFTAWITPADGLGGCCWPEGEPEWLNAAIPPGFLSAGPGASGGSSTSLGVYPVRELVGEFLKAGKAQVTGHFHDAAASDCRRTPLAGMPHRLEAQSAVVADCQRRLVIDSLVWTDG